MADYINLDSVHTPTDGELVPAAWGHAIAQNFSAMHRPYSFAGIRDSNDFFSGTIGNDALTEIGFNYTFFHTGDYFTQTEEAVTSFTVPADGYYFASLRVSVDLTTFTADTEVFVALLFKDDTDDSHYLLRASNHFGNTHHTLGGIVRVEAGTNLSFVVYQDSGADANISYGECAMIYLGRTL